MEMEALRDRLFEAYLVVIDDIGRIADYRGESLYLERVIEKRYNDKLSTILTSNTNLADLPARFQDFLSYFETIPFGLGSKRSLA